MGVLLGAVLLGQFMSGSEPRRTFAAGEKIAVAMMPPTVVCEGQAGELQWTADGSALLAIRQVVDIRPADVLAFTTGAKPTLADIERMRPRFEWVLWGSRSKRSKVVFSGDPTQTICNSIQPMSGTDRFLFTLTENHPGPDGQPVRTDTACMLIAGTGSIVRLANLDETGGFGAVFVSPVRPLGFIQVFDPVRKAASLRFFGPDGKFGNLLPLPNGARAFFDSSGAPGIAAPPVMRNGKRIPQFQRIDPASGRFGPTVDLVYERDESKSNVPDVSIVTGTVAGVAAPGVLLQVAGGKPNESGVVTSDGGQAEVSPKGDAVAYVEQGVAMVRSLVQVPRAAYDQAMLAAAKTVAISNAKQGALACIMFASDNDDVMPGSNDDIRSKLGPYLKNDAILNSFNYTFGGGDMTKIDKPAETEIGYVSGPGGRAVAYADGHVRWIPDGS